MDIWKPSTTVAAVIERDGLLLMIEEHTPLGLRLNQPAGHLDPGETLQDAAVRETLEEAAWHVEPVALLGLYMGRYRSATHGVDVTYLRHAFVCRPLRDEPGRPLDTGIVRALWMTPVEVLAAATAMVVVVAATAPPSPLPPQSSASRRLLWSP